MNRRHWLASAAAAAAALSFPHAHAAAPLKIGFMYSGPVSNVGWTFQHDLGRKLIEKTYGSRISTTFVENVPESADAERVLRQLVADGCKMIFATSFGFMESVIKVAKDHPDVIFEHATGYKMAPNVGIYQSRFYEGAYLLGMLAGRTTKSNTLGFVASFPIPEVIRNIDGFTHGARSVNPKVKTKVVWINSWYDPSRERDAAAALIGQGADVLYQNTDSPAIVQLAQEKGLYAFGQDSDMTAFGPKAHLSANTVNWGVYYVAKVKQALEGKWKAEDTKWGMKEGMIELPAPNPAQNPVLTPDMVKAFEAKKAEILAGKFHPFQGPVKDQSGKVRIASSQAMSEAELWSLNWYVEGVEGKLP